VFIHDAIDEDEAGEGDEGKKKEEKPHYAKASWAKPLEGRTSDLYE